jgi:hypothetical protein
MCKAGSKKSRYKAKAKRMATHIAKSEEKSGKGKDKAGQIGYATTIKKLGKKGAIKKSHQKKESLDEAKDMTNRVTNQGGSFWVDRENAETGKELVKPGDTITFVHKGKKRTGRVTDDAKGRDDDMYRVELDESIDEAAMIKNPKAAQLLIDGAKSLLAIPGAQRLGIGDTQTGEDIAEEFIKLLGGAQPSATDFALYDGKNKDAIAKAITAILVKLAAAVKPLIGTDFRSPKDAGSWFYQIFHFDEAEESAESYGEGSKEQFEATLVEHFDDMVDYLKKNLPTLPVEQVSRLCTVIPVSGLNERTNPVTINKELRALKVKEAATRAEAEKALEIVAEVEESLAATNEAKQIEAAAFKKKLAEATKEDSKEVSALRESIEKKVQEMKDLTAKLTEATKAVEDTKKLLEAAKAEQDKKIQEAKVEADKKVLTEYINMKVGFSGLKLPSTSRALLEKCTSTKEVDSVFEDVQDAMRRGALHPKSVEGDIIVTEKKADPTSYEARVDESIGNVMAGMP